MKFFELFMNPTAAYRGKPFWAWNGVMKPEEVRRQARILQKMGMGGAFMHSRVGLETRYLGKDWFDSIRAGIDECHNLGLEAWLYDEDGFPSGYAGGLVTKNPEHRMKCLMMELVPATSYCPGKSDFPVWEAIPKGGRASDLRQLGKKESPRHGATVLRFTVTPLNPTPWFNNYTYVDTMSADAIREFIRITHDAYKREVGDEFGKTVPGIFTDEPNYGFFLGGQVPDGHPDIPRAVVPWTPKLPETFERMFGYDLADHLPELFLEIDGINTCRARIDYRNCATHMFVTHYAKQIHDWCEENHLMLTGHDLGEETLQSTATYVGATMRFYEHMQAPGIDVLGQFNYLYEGAKQVQSVASQMGRKWVMSELYGCTGWDFPFEGHKAVGDWQAALGVNLRCHHLCWYTMKGESKRDFPGSIFYQSPWWEHYRVVEDYFSRINVALSQGKAVQRLLVIHPIETMFARLRPYILGLNDFAWSGSFDDITATAEMLTKLTKWLLEEHVDFAYGDEEMMGRLGAVQNTKNGPLLKLGKATYDIVLVPPLETIRKSTLTLLDEFSRAGGTVVFAGTPASCVDGAASSDTDNIAGSCTSVDFTRQGVLTAVEGIARRVSITDSAGFEIASALYQLREDGRRHILFICNTDRKEAFDPVTVRVAAEGRVVEHEPETGKRCIVRSKRKSGTVEFQTALPPSGSALFLIDPKPDTGISRKVAWKTSHKQSLSDLVATQLTEPNVLVLDRAQYRANKDVEFKPATEILRLDRLMRQTLGLPYRSFDMLQPWARKLGPDAPSAPLELLFSFEVRELPRNAVSIAIESPTRFEMWLNDRALAADTDMGLWIDPCLRRIPVNTADLRRGINHLRLKTIFREDADLEPVYLIGDFGVELDGPNAAVTGPIPRLEPGDWTRQSLPFYGGAVVYRYRARPKPESGERVVLSAPEFRAAVIRVLVDGKDAGFLAWPPYELDITEHLAEDEAEITLEVFGNRRNTFGPLHQTNLDPFWILPSNFVTEGEDWSDAFAVKPCGLFAHPTLFYQVKV